MNDEVLEYKKLDSSVIENKMVTNCFGKRVVYYEEIDSTNSAAKQAGKQPGNHGLLVLAERQTAGRGRIGRNWSSPGGIGIWMSIILQPKIRSDHASMLTLVAALAVNQGIREVTGLDSFIKWPNDIVINGKKVCGILTEMSTLDGKLECVVIGMGINANQASFSEDLTDKATSLQAQGHKEVDRADLIVNVMKHLEHYYHRFEKRESLIEMIEEYNECLINRNRQVRILGAEEEYIGIAQGINEWGALLVETEEMKEGVRSTSVKAVVSGEVSVRGIYGYV